MILAVTGHRPPKLGGYGRLVNHRLAKFAFEVLTSMTERNTVERVLTGMTLGWDQAIAHACIQQHVYFIAVVPFHGQEKAWPPASQETYKAILDRADQVVVTANGDDYGAWKMHHRNRWLVDHADLLVALWDGSEGGTASCVQYAEKKGLPIVNVWDRWLEFIRTENEAQGITL